MALTPASGKVTKPLSPAQKGVRPLVCSYALHGNRRRRWPLRLPGDEGPTAPPTSLTDSPCGAPSMSQAPPPTLPPCCVTLGSIQPTLGCHLLWAPLLLDFGGFLQQKGRGWGSQVQFPTELGNLGQDLGRLGASVSSSLKWGKPPFQYHFVKGLGNLEVGSEPIVHSAGVGTITPTQLEGHNFASCH